MPSKFKVQSRPRPKLPAARKNIPIARAPVPAGPSMSDTVMPSTPSLPLTPPPPGMLKRGGV